MKIPFIDLSQQHQALNPEFMTAIGKIFESQKFVMGEAVSDFENSVAQKMGTKYAIGLASGTDALFLALLAIGVGPGDEVITTPFTFFATAGSISRTGAVPVFADIDPVTFNLDPKAFESKITSKTKAVIPVHLFGLPAEMDAILQIARAHGIKVIEDAAQSFGATYKGRQTGSMGDAGCFSFYPTKNLGGAGDGGMLVTSSDEIYEKVKLLRDHGSRKKYIHEIVGLNSRLDAIQAAILSIKLKHIDDWNSKRATHAVEYNKGLAGLPVSLPVTPGGSTHIYHLYSILTDKRDQLQAHLTQKEIGSGVYYPLPLHLQPCYKELDYSAGDMPVAEKTASRVLSLALYAEMTGAQIGTVVKTVREHFAQ